MTTAMGPGPEFDRIRAIAEALGSRGMGIGDDAAVIPDGDGHLVISTDASIEGVHFRRDWLTPEEIGWRAAAGALSDLAAMGARPIGLLAAVAGPKDGAAEETVSIMRGIGSAAEACGSAVIGGDLSAASELMITVTVIGRADRPVLRTGATPGDELWVTGALGASRAALLAWESGTVPAPEARAAFANPVPRIDAGAWLAAHGATAMLDLSDGIASDARHLAAASGVRLEIDLLRIPTAGAAVPAALTRAIEPPLLAAQGGEDYELLAALPASFGEEGQQAFERQTGLAITRIGTVQRGSGVRFLLRGERVSLEGFDHFRNDPPARR